MRYEIIDNFLDEDIFCNMQKTIVYSTEFSWHLVRGVSKDDSEDGYYLAHLFYNNSSFTSEYSNLMDAILKKINYFTLKRIKANFYPKTDQIKYHNYHTDFDIPHKGMIFYLNDNNGKTILGDGTIIESISNRVLFFDPSIPHRSTTCTDDPVGRFNLNFNFT
jgi:hypothetical protein